jgi:hypothetical protein
VLCDEHGIGGDGEYFGGNDAQLGRIGVFYHEASGDKYVPRTVFSYLAEPYARAKLGQRPLQKDFELILLPPPLPKCSSPHLSSNHILTHAQRTRVHICPHHWLLCHLGFY